MNDVYCRCPYCYTIQPCPTDCNVENTIYKETCHDCGKNFVFEVVYIKQYTTKQAQCQNGETHIYNKTTIGKHSIEKCILCGEHKPGSIPYKMMLGDQK